MCIKTLNDYPSILGNIDWLHPTLGVPNYQLQNLYMRGLPGPGGGCTLSSLANKKVELFEQ